MSLKIKSKNNKGNPYHDEEGKFTTSDNKSTSNPLKESKIPGFASMGSLYDSMMDSAQNIINKKRQEEQEEQEAMKLFGLSSSSPKKKWHIGTTDSSEPITDEVIEASTQEEAYEIAHSLFPDIYGDELVVWDIDD